MTEYRNNVIQDAVSSINLELTGISSVEVQIIHCPFDPLLYGLDENFRLTKFADLKGRTCKVTQDSLNKLLDGLVKENANCSRGESFLLQKMGAHKIGMH